MLRILLALFLLIPLPVMADHVPTQEPYGYNESVNTETGDLTISLLGSDESLPDAFINDNNIASYFLFAGSDGLMDEMVMQQWQK